ncbi:hypothetical protein [Erwinia tracheiphila]|uniref:hypothetical protein n=1 Tax=Erwinia tracheiphila TaxID=65700 RepID=UPI0003A64CCC|nr:hypothetical protein [Erwinia tracheiphila]
MEIPLITKVEIIRISLDADGRWTKKMTAGNKKFQSDMLKINILFKFNADICSGLT